MWNEFSAQKNPMTRAGFEPETFRSRDLRLTIRLPSPGIGSIHSHANAVSISQPRLCFLYCLAIRPFLYASPSYAFMNQVGQ